MSQWILYIFYTIMSRYIIKKTLKTGINIINYLFKTGHILLATTTDITDESRSDGINTKQQ